MSLIYGVPEMAEEEVLEQIAFQAVQYLRLDDPKYKKADTLSKILVAAKDKPKEDEIVYIEALESIIGENGSYKDLGDAKIVDKSWDTEGTQFNIKGFQACAFEFNGEINVCFRGTPDGAWIDNGYGMAGGDYLIPYENAEQGVSNLGVSPMQHNALEYMQSIVDKNEGKVINISGHSKGGNLAVYGAAMCSDAARGRIERAYSHDGPGFVEEFLNGKAFADLSGRIDKTLPRSSIFGMMFETQEDYAIVESTEFSLLQHNPFSWVVDGRDFVYCERLSAGARYVDGSIREMLLAVSPSERERFVDALFSVFEATGAERFADIAGNLRESLPVMLQAAQGFDKDTRRFVSQTIVAILKCALLPKRPQIDMPAAGKSLAEQLEAWQSELLR